MIRGKRRRLHPCAGVHSRLAARVEDLEAQLRRARRAERARRLESERLNEQLQVLQRAMATTSEGITISDARRADMPLIYVNEGFVRLTGYSRQEVLHRNCRFLQGPDTPPEEVDKIRAALNEGRQYTGELLNYRKDGSPFWNRISLTPLRNSQGKVTHYVGVQSDITERVQAEKSVRDALTLLESVNQQLTGANRRMKRELAAAAKMQQALLPDRVPETPTVRFHWKLIPCEELAGDILNIFRLDADHVGIYLLDVTGHGVAAALLAVSASRMLSPVGNVETLPCEANHEESHSYRLLEPAEVANNLNRIFPWEPESGQFFTLIYGVLNLRRLTFRYVSAGHPPPIHLKVSGDAVLPRGKGLPIGLSETPYEEQVIQMTPGDRLWIYSDGVTETANQNHEAFGNNRLLDTLRRQAETPLEKGMEALLAELRAWRGNRPLEDDISLVAVDARTA